MLLASLLPLGALSVNTTGEGHLLYELGRGAFYRRSSILRRIRQRVDRSVGVGWH